MASREPEPLRRLRAADVSRAAQEWDSAATSGASLKAEEFVALLAQALMPMVRAELERWHGLPPRPTYEPIDGRLGWEFDRERYEWVRRERPA